MLNSLTTLVSYAEGLRKDSLQEIVQAFHALSDDALEALPNVRSHVRRAMNERICRTSFLDIDVNDMATSSLMSSDA